MVPSALHYLESLFLLLKSHQVVGQKLTQTANMGMFLQRT
ncbi:hypothetical protein HMPREF0322_03838 [Desulfitobacterium hafniense DP7]|uniref:Uncharacterized protein n=1 Tax=Desulfitobacterium hafniense DP7 TaxID=537010 RepID=G9XS89_DESHA|nr:hypothetical protein HMPREF0322_03838 [Desulfitobacterium hafniense DP7]